tara:strand:- start:2458 stop:3417 length:960 start_codon:yes stop_codon:yes gene_type:complete
LLLQLCLGSAALAWDATSHRLSVYVAWEVLTPTERDALIEILEQHPRYTEDFLDVMPANVMVGSKETQARWLMGQAGVWPDLTRGLDEQAQIRYNRPNWHWIDGAWMRGSAEQGNVYVGTEPFASIHGEAQGPVEDSADVSNIVLAIEYNQKLLQDKLSSPEQKAVALCWLLHLIGDIHQPLHSGALVSSTLFKSGDRGGNGIHTRGGDNLHSVWDKALLNQPFDDTLRRMNSSVRSARLNEISLDVDAWLQESRQLLNEFVYTDEIKVEVLRSERRGTAMPTIALDDDYIGNMQAYSEDRLTLAGTRLLLSLRKVLKN